MLIQDGSPAIANDALYITATYGDRSNRKGIATAFNINDGSTLWSKKFDSPSRFTPAVIDGKVYIGTSNSLYALKEPQT